MDPFVVIPLKVSSSITFEVKNNQNLSFSTLINNFCHLLNQSTVGFNGQNLINENVRKSRVIKDIILKLNLDKSKRLNFEQEIKKIVPIYFQNYCFSHVLDFDCGIEQNQIDFEILWDLLVYTQ
jgi:hypothetical protein